jgi:hypothetical protein
MDTTAAAKALAHQRWGTRIVDRSLDLLDERSDELGTVQAARLRALADRVDSTGIDEKERER